MCAAYAAQENGDARRALELLRKAAESAERNGNEKITEVHVYKGQSLFEKNRIIQIYIYVFRNVKIEDACLLKRIA